MFLNFFANKRNLDPKRIIEEINRLESSVTGLTNEAIKEKSAELRERIVSGEDLDAATPEVFALCREASKRTLGQRPFDTQMLGGLHLHRGKIVEMLTGEGKTLAAVAPAYLNALSGKGVHVITVNDYLAKRDAVWMGQIYYSLGLKTACIVHDNAFLYDPSFVPSQVAESVDEERDIKGSFLVQEKYLRPITRKEAYLADITYGTNAEFGFDYLRDNLVYDVSGQVQRPHYFAIIDEVDSILIDEARTPLIIAAPDQSSSDYYRIFARAVKQLVEGEDYTADDKTKSVEITDSGIDKVEKIVGVSDLYGPTNFRLVHYLEACLRAERHFLRDRDYVVRDGEVVIVDQFTGRLMFGRRYSAGLHQALEAKEGLKVAEESKTYAQITIQNYFRLYQKISGMTGTAATSAEEFFKVYKLEVTSIPTNKPLVRKDLPDLIYKTKESKYRAIVEDIRNRREKGQPILIGTISIEKNEEFSKYLHRAGVDHEILNAKNNEREGAIIAQAGRPGAVTLATNMAGRGVDIILGGNPPDKEAAAKVREAGGLHVIGTERHEARRIDNQLRGRSGRQGDPGSSRFFLSLEDDLMRIFGGDRLKAMMQTLKIPEDQPIEARLVSKAIAEAQNKVEGFNFDIRKNLLDYDDVLNKQRTNIYNRRQTILHLDDEGTKKMIEAAFLDAGVETPTDLESRLQSLDHLPEIRRIVLMILDMFWMNHLEDIEALIESVRIRAYGHRDPLVEYRRDSHAMFNAMLRNFSQWIADNVFKLQFGASEAVVEEAPKPDSRNFGKEVGRNDPCPCGAKHPDGRPIKYKHCHGENV
ncbi:MAG: preprotein translocase subunit SecA [Patescibacteria group bacterium]|nr:preprotein translocase subunit SecA [Patescibacteria group bacterium]MCL5262001.1 preprotein translocase subunit SecA [Patescibacteria group bacterium]